MKWRNKKVGLSLLVSVILLSSILGYQYALSSVPASGPYYLDVPFGTVSYYVGKFDNGSTYMVKGDTWECTFWSANSSAVINSALGNLTSGRTWKETVLIQGNFTVNTVITISNYTVIKIEGKITLADGSDCNMFTTGTNATDVEFVGGELDGNWENNLSSSGIVFTSYPHRMRVADMYIHNFIENGIHVNDAEMTRIENNVIMECITGLNGTWTDGLISDNHVSRCTTGLWIDGQGTTIVGNDFVDNDIGEVDTYGVYILSQYNVFVGNLFGGSAHGHGVYVQAGSDYNEIVANTIILNDVNMEIAIGTTGNKIKDNLGFVTENSGTQTCADQEWIAHGLDGIPTSVLVSSGNCTYDSVAIIANYVYSSMNSTHFQANIYWSNSTAIPDDVILVSWYVEYVP